MWNVYLLTVLSLVAFGGCVNGDSCGDYGSNDCADALIHACELRLGACRTRDACVEGYYDPFSCERVATNYDLNCEWIPDASYEEYGGYCQLNCEKLGEFDCESEDLKGVCEWTGSGCHHGPLTEWDGCNGYTETCSVELYKHCEWRAGDCREKDFCILLCVSYNFCKENFVGGGDDYCKWDETAEVWRSNCTSKFYGDYDGYQCKHPSMIGICEWDGTQCVFLPSSSTSPSSSLLLLFLLFFFSSFSNPLF
jgi:hypothetical protein